MKYLMFATILLFTTSVLLAQDIKEEQVFQNIVSDLATAWTNGNGAGFAQHFAEEHDFFVWNGIYMPGNTKAANAEGHQRIFDTMYKNTNHFAVLDKVRMITDEVAVIMAMSAVVPKPQSAPEHPHVLWSATLHKKAGVWKIVSFHNADLELLDNEVSRANSPIPVGVMYKSWYDAYGS